MGPNGVNKGVADPLLSPTRPIFLVQSHTDFRTKVLPGRLPSGVGLTLGSAEPGRPPVQVYFGVEWRLLNLLPVDKVSM